MNPSSIVVIPTYKRPDDLSKVLESILSSVRLPNRVLIVDDADTADDMITEMSRRFQQKGVSFTYHKKNHNQVRRGLSESKNLAVKLAQEDIIFYLDDDVILEPNYIEAMMKIWQENWANTQLAGLGGHITNTRLLTAPEKLFRKVFGLEGETAWDINSVGFQVWDDGAKETQKGYYVYGGVSSHRHTILEHYPFTIFSGGRTGLEDVEHCLRLKKDGYYFYYVPSARLSHHPAVMGREGEYEAGKKEGRNRREIFKNHCPQDLGHKIRFTWASVGWVTKKFLSGNWRGAWGMLMGYFV
jgi:glucosyl-dolichyl phosphate glucuronosyltransferase